VEEVATRVGARPPQRLAFADHATAYVGSERRWAGLQRTVQVSVGLPLFALLGRDELASVLAHEFGHELGGDTRLGPWVHRTRRALSEAVEALDGSAFFLDLPFRAYGKLFLRVSAGVSREQERAADRRAAASYGAHSAAGALRVVHEEGELWNVYFDGEVMPLLQRGLRVPLFDGFRRFLAEPRKRPEVARRIEELQRQPPSPWDTHPTLAERLDALAAPAALSAARSPADCLELLGGEVAAEDAWYRIATTGNLRELDWDEVGGEAVLPALREALEQTRVLAPSATRLADLPGFVAEGAALWDRLPGGGIDILSAEAKRKRVRRLLADWLAVALWMRGFQARVRPGASLELQQGELAIDPARVVENLAAGRCSEQDYARLCATIQAALPAA
jgi:Zn-dependent protease with chaperone function